MSLVLAGKFNGNVQVQNDILHSKVATFQEDPNHGTNYGSRQPEGHKPGGHEPGSIMEDGWASQQTWGRTPYNPGRRVDLHVHHISCRLMGSLDKISRFSLLGVNLQMS